jgi:hypothetical protein
MAATPAQTAGDRDYATSDHRRRLRTRSTAPGSPAKEDRTAEAADPKEAGAETAPAHGCATAAAAGDPTDPLATADGGCSRP